MKGQWVGRYQSTFAGAVIADIDDDGERYHGFVRLIADPTPDLGALVRFRTEDNKAATYHLSAPIQRVDLSTGQVLTNEDLTKRYPDLRFPSRVDFTIQMANDDLAINWTGDNSVSGNAVIPKSQAQKPSQLEPQRMTWEKFKRHVTGLPGRRFIFRGQEKQWRLQTNYHRTGRSNLELFLANDIQALHRNLSARTKHIFNLSIPDENGAFMHLVQHHGYPTPLLDWTYSPFVAAYFAFNRASTQQERPRPRAKPMCRIFMFDKKAWMEDLTHMNHLVDFKMHFSVMEFIPIENERMIPQQALSTVTNIYDIESYIIGTENRLNKKYLHAIDIATEERPAVMRDLQMMGVTAGSLFPGLDGTCAELKARFFPI